MAIANELSSDVAAAVLKHDDDEVCVERKELIEIVRNFYLALRPLTIAARRQRMRVINSFEPLSSPPPNNRAASGNH